jgi:hypothetical protein
MPLAKLFHFSDPGRDHLRKRHDMAAPELQGADCLDSEAQQVEHEPLQPGLHRRMAVGARG